MNSLSIAVVGAGVAGLSFAAQVSSLKNITCKVYERASKSGGRVNAEEVRHGVFADLGANLIDFDNEQQEERVRKFLKTLKHGNGQDNLKVLERPFLIYDKELKKADYHKDRYNYEGGFKRLIEDIQSTLPKDSYQFNVQIQSIRKDKEKWLLFGKDGEELDSGFDYLICAADGPGVLNLLQASKLPQFTQLTKNIAQIAYTTQISAAFELVKGHQQFSSILFKDQKVTFMSSHCQKYPQAYKKIVVIQMNEQFSKEHYQADEKAIGEAISYCVPKPTNTWIGECLTVKKWNPSLIRLKKTVDFSSFWSEKERFGVIGDVSRGSSRVTGAIESAIFASQRLKKHYV